MPLSREKLTRLHGQAVASRDLRVQALAKVEISGKQLGTDPEWRRLNANVRQIQRRLDAVTAKEANNAAVAEAKAAREAVAAE